MTEEKLTYQALVHEKVQVLEATTVLPVTHGSEGVCPNCGHYGQYDLEAGALSASSIYFSMVEEDWRCQMCEFESLGI